MRGELIEEWANSLNLVLLNEGNESTCVRSQGDSIVDLTWCSYNLVGKIHDWRVDGRRIYLIIDTSSCHMMREEMMCL